MATRDPFLIFDAVFDMKETPIRILSLSTALTKQAGAICGAPSSVTVDTHVRVFCLSQSGFSKNFNTSSVIATIITPHILIVYNAIKELFWVCSIFQKNLAGIIIPGREL
jgi:hypothetical protein